MRDFNHIPCKICCFLAGFFALLVLLEVTVRLEVFDSGYIKSFLKYFVLGCILAIFFYITYHLFLLEIFLGRRKTFSCERCGHCCKLKIQLTQKDIEKLKEKGLKRYISKGYLKKINGYCPFLTIKKGKAKCNIYKIRPERCRKFPEKSIVGLKAYDARCKRFQDAKF